MSIKREIFPLQETRMHNFARATLMAKKTATNVLDFVTTFVLERSGERLHRDFQRDSVSSTLRARECQSQRHFRSKSWLVHDCSGDLFDKAGGCIAIPLLRPWLQALS